MIILSTEFNGYLKFKTVHFVYNLPGWYSKKVWEDGLEVHIRVGRIIVYNSKFEINDNW